MMRDKSSRRRLPLQKGREQTVVTSRCRGRLGCRPKRRRINSTGRCPEQGTVSKRH